MKSITLAASFVLTIWLAIIGTVVYPNYFGPSVTSNNECVFGFFLGRFFDSAAFWGICEKVALTIRRMSNRRLFNE